MTIQSEKNGKSSMVLFVEGRLDTASTPQLERKIKQWGDGVNELILDFSKLGYISSMGLRVLLQTQKTLNAQHRKLVIRHIAEPIRQVFEVTGFINLMVQEEKLVIIRKDEPALILLSLMGQMDAPNVSILEKELYQIKELNQPSTGQTVVVLDMEKLTDLSVPGCRVLRETLTETSWADRKLFIKNASPEVCAVLKSEGLAAFLESQF